jgi:hypothetical protein
MTSNFEWITEWTQVLVLETIPLLARLAMFFDAVSMLQKLRVSSHSPEDRQAHLAVRVNIGVETATAAVGGQGGYIGRFARIL